MLCIPEAQGDFWRKTDSLGGDGMITFFGNTVLYCASQLKCVVFLYYQSFSVKSSAKALAPKVWGSPEQPHGQSKHGSAPKA